MLTALQTLAIRRVWFRGVGGAEVLSGMGFARSANQNRKATVKAWLEKWAWRAAATLLMALVLSCIGGCAYLEYKKALFYLTH